MRVHLTSALILTALILAASSVQARILGPVDERLTTTEIRNDTTLLNKLTLSDGLSLTLADLEQIEGALGAIICLQTDGSQKISSGALIDASDRVTTTLHSFDQTILSSCVFKNFNGQESKFLFSNSDAKKIARYRKASPIGTDQIEVELESVISASPFTGDNSPLSEREEFYGVTAYEDDLNAVGVIADPFIRKAIASNIQVNAQGEQVGYISDADFSHGGSGGVNLFWRNGQLVAKGTFQGLNTPRGEKIQDHEMFDPTRNFILSTTLRHN